LVFGFVNAQKAQFGFKGGLNVANQSFSGDGAPSPSSKVGFHVGGFVEIKVSDKFAIQPELLYSTQGSKFNEIVNYQGTDYKAEVTLKLSYINIPFMLKYYAADKFSLEAGPQIGFLTTAKLAVKNQGNSNEQDIKDIFKSTDFGLNLGVGYEFAKNFSAGVRYNIGLTNIVKDGSGDEIKNNVFSLSLGCKF